MQLRMEKGRLFPMTLERTRARYYSPKEFEYFTFSLSINSYIKDE